MSLINSICVLSTIAAVIFLVLYRKERKNKILLQDVNRNTLESLVLKDQEISSLKSQQELKDRQIVSLEDRNRQLVMDTHLDPLTQIHNRSYMEAKFRELYGSKRKEIVLFIDVDKFKTVNDIAGHKEGDRYLRSIAQAITDSCRKFDIIGRIGGDEFLIILTNVTLGSVSDRIIKRIHKNVEKIVMCEKLSFYRPSVSVGICPTNDETSLEVAKEKADLQMLEEKESKKALSPRITMVG